MCKGLYDRNYEGKVEVRKLHWVSLSCSEDLKLVHFSYCTQYKVRMITPQNFVETVHCNCL